MFDIQAELSKLPHKPGVYLMHDAEDNVIYVGKAKNLYNRVRSYFRASTPHTLKINTMISLIDHFEYIVVDSELEAFMLEINLIKEYSPQYNTLLKDSHSYPYIKVSMYEEYPRISLAHYASRDKGKYFGPFVSGTAVKETIEFLNMRFKLKTCNKVCSFGNPNGKSCLNYHMDRCTAPCTGNVSKEEYFEKINAILAFLNGTDKSLQREVKAKMEEASEKMLFEDAIKYRDLLESLNKVSEKQKITDSDLEDRDVIGIAADESDAVVQVFFIRDGKMIGREHHHIGEIAGLSQPEILQDFLKNYYSGTPYLPKEIVLPFDIEERDMMGEWLSILKGSKVSIVIPKIGSKEKFTELANKNASMVLFQDKEKILKEEKHTLGAMKELSELIGLENIKRVEAYDISNTNGFENVGSMVVFENGKKCKGDYRRFRIKSVEGPNDYACMYEVLSRRFVHGFEEKRKLEEENLEASYGGFAKFPDLILMDGGRGQVNICKKVLDEFHLNIPVCGMVKDDNHNTRGLYVDGVEIDIDRASEAFKLITRIQDEAHRFAIEYHKSLRGKDSVHSALDNVPGIGPSRRKALMKAFGSLDEIKGASVEKLAQTEGISKSQAQVIFDFFHKP